MMIIQMNQNNQEGWMKNESLIVLKFYVPFSIVESVILLEIISKMEQKQWVN